jgi:hypothetical protein
MRASISSRRAFVCWSLAAGSWPKIRAQRSRMRPEAEMADSAAAPTSRTLGGQGEGLIWARVIDVA